jgi:DNA-binding transcriptional MerR regulator
LGKHKFEFVGLGGETDEQSMEDIMGKNDGERPAAGQSPLFDGDFSLMPADVGYRGPIACQAVGITYRQLDYWARTGLVAPSIQRAVGSGTQRLYSFRDLLLLKVVKQLLDTGVELQKVRLALSHLRERGVVNITEITLVSDGVSVYECTTDNEIVDLVKGGQGMFAIGLGQVWRGMEGVLAKLPTEHRAEPHAQPVERPELRVVG